MPNRVGGPRSRVHGFIWGKKTGCTVWYGWYVCNFDSTPNPFIIHGLHTEFIARKLCPELVVVSTHFPRYMEISNKVMDIFRRYDPNMQPGGCDEGYLKYVICLHRLSVFLLITRLIFQYHWILWNTFTCCGRMCPGDARYRTQGDWSYGQRWYRTE